MMNRRKFLLSLGALLTGCSAVAKASHAPALGRIAEQTFYTPTFLSFDDKTVLLRRGSVRFVKPFGSFTVPEEIEAFVRMVSGAAPEYVKKSCVWYVSEDGMSVSWQTVEEQVYYKVCAS